MISQLGVVLFMFLVGLHLDARLLAGRARTTCAIAHASIVIPFLLGSGLAIGLYPVYSTADVSFTVFSLFLGVSLMAWKVLAFLGYVVLMLALVRPLLARFAARQDARQEPASPTALAIVFSGVLLSACATESLGVHALFGAFLLGALLPHTGGLADGIRSRLEEVVLVLFLPAFFALTGLRTEIGLLSSARDRLVCGLIVLVATVGKLGGTFIAARLSGLPARSSTALGVLMNTRGLMELIVLNVGLDLRVITPTVFTMMVIMALVTTFAATPVLDVVLGRRGFADGPGYGQEPSTSVTSRG